MRSLISLCFLCAYSFFSAQSQVPINLDINSFEEAVAYEENLKSTIKDTVYLILGKEDSGLDKPIVAVIFKREVSEFPIPLHVWYYLDVDFDKLIRVGYYHGFYNPSWNANKDVVLLEELTNEEDAFVSRFHNYMDYLINQFGEPDEIKKPGPEWNVQSGHVKWKLATGRIELKYVFFRRLIQNPGLGYQVNNFELSFERTFTENF
ncbi:hypothetical protein [Reichenbachiella ulvae]|uniref:Uncharacterized protein n=1 Tax=Reichenbachiella ulvae TaxID=2980104 RepID=A0ABT3CQ32_9BACT|nr:hypothetical protein [Reichenbachiella ulvae]MCV9385658.1 hypothetical protein [Reichenbachiella ulvae]